MSNCWLMPRACWCGRRSASSSSPDLHLEKGSSFAARGVLLPPYDTAATLAQLGAAIARHDPRMVIALGDSFHDREAHGRLSQGDRDTLAALQVGRDWVWIAGNHDPAPPVGLRGYRRDTQMVLGGAVIPPRADWQRQAKSPVTFIRSRACRPAGRSISRRCFAADGERIIMPAFGAYTGGLQHPRPRIRRAVADGGADRTSSRRSSSARLSRRTLPRMIAIVFSSEVVPVRVKRDQNKRNCGLVRAVVEPGGRMHQKSSSAVTDTARAWRGKGFLKTLGPGLITGASDDDPSGIGTYSQAGAQIGFGIGWTMLLTSPLMVAIQEISARLGRTTGHGIAGNACRYYSQSLTLGLVALLFVANVINIGANLGAMADAVKTLIGGPGARLCRCVRHRRDPRRDLPRLSAATSWCSNG